MSPFVPLPIVVVPTMMPVVAAVTVQVEPSVQVWPFTVVAVLTKSALVTNPVAIKLLVTVSPEILGEVASTTFPEPVVL